MLKCIQLNILAKSLLNHSKSKILGSLQLAIVMSHPIHLNDVFYVVINIFKTVSYTLSSALHETFKYTIQSELHPFLKPKGKSDILTFVSLTMWKMKWAEPAQSLICPKV